MGDAGRRNSAVSPQQEALMKTHIYSDEAYGYREPDKTTWALCGRRRAIDEMYSERSRSLARISELANICRHCWKKHDPYGYWPVSALCPVCGELIVNHKQSVF